MDSGEDNALESSRPSSVSESRLDARVSRFESPRAKPKIIKYANSNSRRRLDIMASVHGKYNIVNLDYSIFNRI